MLYKITKAGLSFREFKRCIENIEIAFYDEKSYLDNRQYIDLLPSWTDKPEPEKCLDEIAKSLDEITKKRCSYKNLYSAIQENGQLKGFYFPFADRFQRYFMKRKWHNPVNNPRQKAEELLCLENERIGDIYANYSNNVRDFKHFINVVAAMARLINFFRSKDNTDTFITRNDALDVDVSYHERHGFRIFTLMLAAFYHDIGKTVEYHRHGMEGSIILSDHRSKSWNDFVIIIEEYQKLYPTDFCYNFEHDDLIFISDFLYYHDQFGTLSTGESGYLRLVDLVSRIKRHSLIHNKRQDDRSNRVQTDQKEWSYRFLFDLWLLNLADIIVSRDNKDEVDLDWEYEEKANNKIKEFLLSNEQAAILIHDLNISFKLMNDINLHLHSDNLSELYKITIDFSKRHTTERLRRLIFKSIEKALKHFYKVNNYDTPIEDITEKQQLYSVNNILRKFTETQDEYMNPDDVKKASYINAYNEMRCIVEKLYDDLCIGAYDNASAVCPKEKLNTLTREVNAIITQHIKTVGEFDVFSERFSLVGQMDYALGCFQQIVATALDCVYAELIVPHIYKSKLIRDANAEAIDDAFLVKLKGKLLVENLTSIFIEIIHHLLFRDEFGTRLRNIEFNDLKNRLNDEKIRAILSQDGHARMKRALQLILQTVFLY
ncbi:MAG: hypothetical protein L7F77_09460 [Candidatus Magnetominusculus sp. LBB02]|nr:hypothetical protein [Candidatus Magnetominusculus sp. LBB02]